MTDDRRRRRPLRAPQVLAACLAGALLLGAAAPDRPAARTENLIVNPAFLAEGAGGGKPRGWTVTTAKPVHITITQDPTMLREGRPTTKIAVSMDTEPASHVYTLSQDLTPIVPKIRGKRIRLSGWFYRKRGLPDTPYDFHMDLPSRDEVKKQRVTLVPDMYAGIKPGAWQYIERIGDVPGGDAIRNASLRWECYGVTQPDYEWVSDLRLEVLPEATEAETRKP